MLRNNGVFEQLPDETLSGVETFLSDSDRSRFASTAYLFYSHSLTQTTSPFFNSHIRSKCYLVQQLLRHVVYGQENSVYTMLLSDPGLLLEKGRVRDYSGRVIIATAFQAALGADDLDMCLWMLSFFDKLPSGRETAWAQFEEQCLLDTPSLQGEYDISQLVTCITKEQFIENQLSLHTIETLDHFRKSVQASGVITSGKHFDLKTYVDALTAYKRHYQTWEINQCSLYWRQVIGYLQRLLPACYAQAFCQGIYTRVELGRSLERSMQLYGNISYFPLDANPDFRLGYDYALYSQWDIEAPFALAGFPNDNRRDGLNLLIKYIKSRNEGFEILKSMLLEHRQTLKLP